VSSTSAAVDEGGRGDLQWGSIWGLVTSTAERFPELEAMVDGDVRLSFPELAWAVRRAARAAMSAGVELGDRVAIWAPNCHEWAIAALGAVSAGGVLVPLNTRFKGHEAAYILAKSGASVLFTVTDFLDSDYVSELRRALAEDDRSLPCLSRTVVLRGPVPDGAISWVDYLAGGEAINEEAMTSRAAVIGPDHLSDIIFTSGTTGRPKGAMVTHGQSLRVFADWADIVGLDRGDRYLVVNPFFHTFGYKAGLLASLMKGATVLPHAVFDVGAVLEKVAAERISMLPGPPTLYHSILEHPDRSSRDLSSLRLAVTGAAVVPVELVRRMREELTFRTVITGYGLTESSGAATMCRHDDDPETISRTAGRAIPGTEVKVADGSGREAPRGEPGEVLVRGYNVMRSYYDEPEETAAAIDAGGWLHTGDIGVMDDRGYLTITDRKKDMFIVGGFNAYPAEIEGILLENEAIAQVAVVGVPDERMGEVGVAFVVARQGTSPSEEGVISWAREHMANFKIPRRVHLVGGLPLNASGKVLKYELRRRATGASGAS
jgi:HIP---CoA ligase